MSKSFPERLLKRKTAVCSCEALCPVKAKGNVIMVQNEAEWCRNEVIPAFGKGMQEDKDLEVSLNYMISYIITKKKLEKESKMGEKIDGRREGNLELLTLLELSDQLKLGA